jgi:hypothetical protein
MNHLYAQHPRNIADLRDKTAAAFEQITPKVLDKTWKHMAAQYHLFCECQGGHVEVY